jgi:AcrR family transcriptional regulator
MSTRASEHKRRRLSAGQRRERILESALRVFAERGYQEASIGQIAMAAGITPAVIYDHFASKAALQIELLERQTAEVIAFVASALEASPEQAGERLRVGVDAFFRFVEEHGFAWRMLFRDPPSDPEVAAAYRRLSRRATEGITGFIEAGAGDALAAYPDPRQAAEMFAELVRMSQNGLAAWWYEHKEVPRETIVERMLEFCWVGLERVASGDRPSSA